MNKSFLLLPTLALIFISSQAQTKFGIRGGISFSSQNGSSSSSTDLMTIHASVFAMQPLSSSVIFQPSIGYHPKGNKYRNVTFTDPLGNNTGYGDYSVRFDNIEFTAPFQYIIMNNKERRLLLGLGPFFTYAVGGMAKWKNTSGQADPPSKAKIAFGGTGEKRLDAGVDLLLTFQADKHWMLNVHYDRGLIQTNRNTSLQQQKFYSNSQGITVGYLFK